MSAESLLVASRLAALSDSSNASFKMAVGCLSRNTPPRSFNTSMGCAFPERSVTSVIQNFGAGSNFWDGTGSASLILMVFSGVGLGSSAAPAVPENVIAAHKYNKQVAPTWAIFSPRECLESNSLHHTPEGWRAGRPDK